MQHCFIYYLNNSLPRIEVIDLENNEVEVINELFEKVSKEKERDFPLKGEDFKFYITKTLKEGNRKIITCITVQITEQLETLKISRI